MQRTKVNKSPDITVENILDRQSPRNRRIADIFAKCGLVERSVQETLESFSTHDFLIVDLVHRERSIPTVLRDRLPRLLDMAIIERISRNRFILGKQYYRIAGKTGVYTRKKGLDRETCKALILKHVTDNRHAGSKLGQFFDVLPGRSRGELQSLLRELRNEGKIRLVGATSSSFWFPVD